MAARLQRQDVNVVLMCLDVEHLPNPNFTVEQDSKERSQLELCPIPTTAIVSLRPRGPETRSTDAQTLLLDVNSWCMYPKHHSTCEKRGRDG